MTDKEYLKLLKIIKKVTQKWKSLTRDFLIRRAVDGCIPFEGFISFKNIDNEKRKIILTQLYQLQEDLDWLRSKLLPMYGNELENSSEKSNNIDAVSIEEYIRAEDKIIE